MTLPKKPKWDKPTTYLARLREYLIKEGCDEDEIEYYILKYKGRLFNRAYLTKSVFNQNR